MKSDYDRNCLERLGTSQTMARKIAALWDTPQSVGMHHGLESDSCLMNQTNQRNRMKILMRRRSLKPRASSRELVEAQWKRLQNLAARASAEVTLKWQSDVKPAFRVLTLLKVPRPDFHAEAAGHTLEAALLKAVQNLEQQIRPPNNRRADRFKSKQRLGLIPARRSTAFATHRA
jgi:ribosome-associated translation inhibitor RaiA